MNRLFVLVVAALVATVTANPLVVMEDGRTASPPSSWTSLGPAADEHPVRLTVALHLRRVDILEEAALAVSDPASPDYGQHLDLATIHAMVAPAPEHVEAVRRWLLASGDVRPDEITMIGHGDFMVVHTTARVASALMGGAAYHMYRHEPTGVVKTRLEPGATYALPRDAAEAVAFVAPAHHFPRSPGSNIVRRAPHPESLLNTAGTLLELYGYPKGLAPVGLDKNSATVLSFIQQYYSPKDLTTYQTMYANFTHNSIVSQVGKNDPSSPGDEASLDVQVLASTNIAVNTSVWYFGSEDTPFLEWVTYANSQPVVPLVHSASYGSDEDSLSPAYILRLETELAKLAARGVTVLIAAGDSGAGCTNTSIFNPDWPASSAWVTAVGGAAFGTAGKFPTGEVVDGIGGGGCSNVLPRPSWQADAVAQYFNGTTKLPPANVYNHTGRCYPDVAAQSEGFVIVIDGLSLPFVGGTSCATPTVAAIVSLLNGVRLAAGKPSLGFLNPLIYSGGHAGFSDIVSGQNYGCLTTGGFNAATGWDPASGWGTPNYERLATLIQQLP